MTSTNKKGAGFILSLLTAIAGVVGLVFCMVNANTDSFRKIGTSPVVIACAVIAIVTLVVAAAQFISPRVNTIASIMSFTNNAQTMADLSSAIYGTAALLIAVVLNIIAAFTNVTKE